MDSPKPAKPPLRERAVREAMKWRASRGAMSKPQGPPPAIERDLDETFADYWRRRIDQHHDDSWAVCCLPASPRICVSTSTCWAVPPHRDRGRDQVGRLDVFVVPDQLRTFASYGRLRARAARRRHRSGDDPRRDVARSRRPSLARADHPDRGRSARPGDDQGDRSRDRPAGATARGRGRRPHRRGDGRRHSRALPTSSPPEASSSSRTGMSTSSACTRMAHR